MSWLRDNIWENPMMAEVGRLRQVVKGRGRGATGLRLAWMTAAIIAGCLLWIIGFSEGHVEPVVTLYAQLIFCCIAIPLMFYGSIAGEREKRSWELLRVAPVTNLQLAIGKFAAMASVVVGVHLIFLLPLLYSVGTFGEYYRQETYTSSSGYVLSPYASGYEPMFSSWGVCVAEFYSGLLALFVAGLTLFFSARSKRSYTALALTIGTLVVLFVLIPVFTSGLGREFTLANFLDPMSNVGFLAQARYPNREDVGINELASYSSMFAVVFLTISLVIYASYTMAFADNLVKFLPNRK